MATRWWPILAVVYCWVSTGQKSLRCVASIVSLSPRRTSVEGLSLEVIKRFRSPITPLFRSPDSSM